MSVANRQSVSRMLGRQSRTTSLLGGLTVGGKRGLVVTGVAELDAKLAMLEPKIQRKVAKKVLRDAVKRVILPRAKAMAPIETGALEKSLTVRAMKRSRKARIGFVVQTRDGMFKGKQFYGAFQEFGTKHMEADPFLRPAGYSSEGEIRDIVIGGIRNELRLMKTKVRLS